VPSVVGTKVPEARETLAAKGFKLGTQTSESSNTVPSGQIISQTPAANQLATKDTAVNVVVSGGQTSYDVPNVIGESEERAKTLLENAHFTVGDSNKVESDRPAGEVIDISPDPDKQYPAGTRFTLTVSTGQAKVKVPEVLGMSPEDATKELKDAGLSVAYKERPSDQGVEGTVIDQSEAPGKRVDKGTKVTITIATKPDEPPPSTPPSPPDTSTTPSPDPSTNSPSGGPSISVPTSGGNGNGNRSSDTTGPND
jgi:eukaryotic-like serine/threonine-protein kinase